ncbi:hypothetical protein AVEN_266501-1 [Araneus ventricosus]|uniref:Uncharacterized protein n=1 Tax=Araneus ventricosus TaxID=182803 RepID=A0A4Y2I3Q4_ARAVE|nr:hypothetical protein AVEN_266501-1 [Araneus ventricosus]
MGNIRNYFEMKNLAEGSLNDDVRPSLWKQSLPDYTQHILCVSAGNIASIPKVIDKVNEVSVPGVEVSTVTENLSLRADIAGRDRFFAKTGY